MNTALSILMMAACICGYYKNEANLPPRFDGNLAQAVEDHKQPKKPTLPYYTRSYGNIVGGEILSTYATIFRLSMLYFIKRRWIGSLFKYHTFFSVRREIQSAQPRLRLQCGSGKF